jgi:hypothetical protein
MFSTEFVLDSKSNRVSTSKALSVLNAALDSPWPTLISGWEQAQVQR